MFEWELNKMEDDDMFSSLASVLPRTAPKNAELVTHHEAAPPPQVVVYMPSPPEKAAVSQVASLKLALYMLMGIFAIALVLFAWYHLRRASSDKAYEGRALPGIVGPTKVAEKEPVRQVRPYIEQPVEPVFIAPPPAPTAAPMAAGFEDIVPVTGPMPIWDMPEETVDDTFESRVSETSNSIVDLIKARESMTKDIEHFMSSTLKETA